MVRPACRASGRAVAVVDGGVGVFLRVHDPRKLVDDGDQAVDLQPVGELDAVVVGQVEQDQAGQVVGVDDARWGRRASRAGGAQDTSGTTAPWALEVVGRVTPTVATFAPVRALNNDDLPLPVAPARATAPCGRPREARAGAGPGDHRVGAFDRFSRHAAFPASSAAAARALRRSSSETWSGGAAASRGTAGDVAFALVDGGGGVAQGVGVGEGHAFQEGVEALGLLVEQVSTDVGGGWRGRRR